MRMLVVGTGAVGGYLGARLCAAGEDVTFVARGEQGRALRERGLLLHTPQGDERIALRKVTELGEASGRFDVIWVAVKWPELESVCEALPGLLAPHGVVVPLLNGLDSEDVVARYVGAQRTVAGVAYMSAGRLAPGELYVHGNTRVGLAPYRDGQDDIVGRLAARFERAGVPVRRNADARTMRWEKMVWNAPFNAICALTQKPAGVVADTMEELVRDAMREVTCVAHADGAALPPAIVDTMVQLTRVEFPHTEPSMLQDVRAKRPTEGDHLQGAVVERGRALGVDTPVLRVLHALVRGLSPESRDAESDGT